MGSAEWLGAHRDEIVKRWKERVRPLVSKTGATNSCEWEDRVFACFNQVQKLVNGASRVCIPEQGIESRLFRCSAVNSDDDLQLRAWTLASGRRAIGDVSGILGDREAKRCAEECGGAIDYLEHTLQINACLECPVIQCCIRIEVVEPMRGGVNE